jgi:hypothetical protein
MGDIEMAGLLVCCRYTMCIMRGDAGGFESGLAHFFYFHRLDW